MPPLGGGKVVRSTKGGGVMVAANAANFIGCFAAVVGALKYGWAPLMIEPENRAFVARGKHANQATPVGNASPLARFAGLPPQAGAEQPVLKIELHMKK